MDNAKNSWKIIAIIYLVWVMAARVMWWSQYSSYIDSFDMVIHEMGHPMFWTLGKFMGAAGGSIVQVGVPAVAAAYAWFSRRSLFWTGLSLLWMSVNLLYVGIYAYDAAEMVLPLWSPFGDGHSEPIHDWEYMLNRLVLVDYAKAIGRTIFTVGCLTNLAGAVLATTGAISEDD